MERGAFLLVFSFHFKKTVILPFIPVFGNKRLDDNFFE